MDALKVSPQQQMFSLVVGFWQSRALAIAVELGVADILAERAMDVQELAARTKTSASALHRLLRSLESIGVFSQQTEGLFCNSEASESLREGLPGSQRSLILSALSAGNGQFEGWSKFEYAIQTGTPAFDKVHGCNFWEYGKRNPVAGRLFDDFMRSVSETMTSAITEAFDWSQFRTIVDVGGGIGTQLRSILEAFPSVKGILFDQPHVTSNAIPGERFQIQSGDFFESVPQGGDAYLLRWIIHDWSDEAALAILKCVCKSFNPATRLVVVESVVSEEPVFDMAKWLDLQMLAMLEGRERTEREYRSLLLAAGFELEQVIPTAAPVKILIARLAE
ncbi:methyltransferase [Paraburkholderia sp. J12]|uniref:methyltransferase n=1 Tax=Paraburkholderia sp. J12 TaxID=2805432 RepID=UPI002ABDFA43|nr:methyltransferase [Paraburkholderia sp. J12]